MNCCMYIYIHGNLNGHLHSARIPYNYIYIYVHTHTDTHVLLTGPTMPALFQSKTYFTWFDWIRILRNPCHPPSRRFFQALGLLSTWDLGLISGAFGGSHGSSHSGSIRQAFDGGLGIPKRIVLHHANWIVWSWANICHQCHHPFALSLRSSDAEGD